MRRIALNKLKKVQNIGKQVLSKKKDKLNIKILLTGIIIVLT